MPDDIAIVGYDDIEYAAAAAVPLSSVAQPRHELGRTAARLLLDEAEQGASTSTSRWCSRRSSSLGPPPPPSPEPDAADRSASGASLDGHRLTSVSASFYAH